MKKRVIFGIVLFLFIGFFAFTFANPNEKVSDENKVVDKRDDSVVDNEKNKGTDLKIKRFLKLKGIVKEGWLPYVKRWCNRNARCSFRSFT